MAEDKVEKYENPISVTAQFRFCGNPLRADMYRNCSFQCNYCFAKTHISHYDNEKDELNGYGWIEKADIKEYNEKFKFKVDGFDLEYQKDWKASAKAFAEYVISTIDREKLLRKWCC